MIRIIVGGDNQTTLNIHACLQELFRVHAAEVLYATTPNEALARHETKPAGLIIVHFEISELTNFEVFRLIRDSQYGHSVPIFVLSGDAFIEGAPPPDDHTRILPSPLTAKDLAAEAGTVFGVGLQVAEDAVLEVSEEELARQALIPGPGDDGGDEVRDDDDATEVIDPIEQRRRELERLTNVRFMTRSDVQATKDAEEVEAEADQFYIIPDGFRYRFFYTNDFVQSILDRIEDSRLFQAHCRRKAARGGRVYRASDHAADGDFEDLASWRQERSQRRAEILQRAGIGVGRSALRIVLVVLILVLIGGVWFASRMLRELSGDDEPEAEPDSKVEQAETPKGSLDVLMCSKCGHIVARPVKNVHEEACPKCKGRMGFAWHCEDCDKDFAYLPPGDVRLRSELPAPPKCPECGGSNVTALKPSAEEK